MYTYSSLLWVNVLPVATEAMDLNKNKRTTAPQATGIFRFHAQRRESQEREETFVITDSAVQNFG